MDQQEAITILSEALNKMQVNDSIDIDQIIKGKCNNPNIGTLLRRIGSYVKRVRNVRGITQTRFAKICDSSVYMISKLEKGQSVELDQFLAFMRELGTLDSIVLLLEHHLDLLQEEEECVSVKESNNE